MSPDRDPLPPRALVALLVDVLDRPTPRQRYADGAWGILLALRPRHPKGVLPVTNTSYGLIPEDRFWKRVSKTEGCWEWIGKKNAKGYGVHGWWNMSTEKHRKMTGLAHRISYELSVGPIPAGLGLDHLCRVHHCVRPDHLEPVTTKENLNRSPLVPWAVKRAQTHCMHGHEFTPENTFTSGSGNGRGCRECRKIRSRAWKLAHKPAPRDAA